MSTKQDLEILVKKLKEELRELRKEVIIQSDIELPKKSFITIKSDKPNEFIMYDVELNPDTKDIKIVGESIIKTLSLAMYKSKEKLAYSLTIKG